MRTLRWAQIQSEDIRGGYKDTSTQRDENMTAGKLVLYTPRRQASRETNPAHTLGLDF